MSNFTPYYYFSSTGEDFYALCDSKTGRILNVSATEHGLTWTTSTSGKLLYYTNGKIKITPSHVYIVSSDNEPLKRSNDVFVRKLNYRNTAHNYELS